MSLLVRRGRQPTLLLVGDLTYGADILDRDQIPGVGSRWELTDTTRKVLALRERLPSLVILPVHGPSAASRLQGSQ